MKPNWVLLFCGVFFWLMETRFFGWNKMPGSIAELFADGMSLFMIGLAFQRPIYETKI